jgi:hypothetical protein
VIGTPENQHAYILAFANALAVRDDGPRIRQRLADAFVLHREDLWPAGEPAATPEWIDGHVDVILATIERLYAVVVTGEHPGAQEFLDRMAWLPVLLNEVKRGEVDYSRHLKMQ